MSSSESLTQDHTRSIQYFLKYGKLYKIHNNYIIIKRFTASGFYSSYQYGIGCFACNILSWNPQDVDARFCPKCKTWWES